MTLTTEKQGQRVYVTGNSYAVKAELKSLGCHWDGDRRQWWIGATKEADLTALLAELTDPAQPKHKEDLGDKRVYAKVAYKGRRYYVIGESGDRCRLTVLDGSLDFWADMSACDLIKTYEGSQRFAGYKRGQVTVYTTLGNIQSFVASQKRAEAGGKPACACCGKRGDLHQDLEDGLMKCHSCCDIPA